MNGTRPRYLFVYGTLRQGCRNEFAARLSRSSVFLGGARVQGRLYQVAQHSGLVLTRRDEASVSGEVYALRQPGLILRILDGYEGPSYKRAVAPVRLDSGEWIKAAVYVYDRKVAGKKRIRSGDYLAWRRTRT